MPEEPPNIDSEGEQPTNFGDGPPERDSTPEQGASKPERPEKQGPPPSDFHISPSDGELDTYRVEQRLSQFVSSGTELPPELVEEQKSVLLQPGDMVADRFEVVKQLGFGGMGAVYHVKDRTLGTERALKVMLPSLLKSKEARERFLAEVRISQTLRHEQIVSVYDLGEDREHGFRFFTMELVEGKTLNRLLRDRGGKLPLDEALDIVRQLCDALEYAHQYTVHRDLKPQNIMIRPDGSIKVLDFGLAKLMSPGRMTRSSMALGTAYYQAPEQSIHLSDLDQRADIYSVGVILYQMLSGKIPAGRFESLAKVVRGIPRPLSDLVDQCLDPKPEGRPRSAAQLRADLERAAKKRRAKWQAPAFAIGVIAVIVLGTVAWKLGTVPRERSETGLSPISHARVESAEPSPPAPEPSVAAEEPSATASEASTARRAAVVAQQAAQSAGAEEHALGLWDEAVKHLKQAEAHDTLESFDDAIGGYNAAANTFEEAETEAARIAGEIESLEQAKGDMQAAKSEADTLDAAQYAKVRYEQAMKAEEEAAGIVDDRVAAAEAYQKAAERYQLAVDETKQQGAAIVAAAKKSAETAKEQANTSDVRKYSAKELEAAQGLFDRAGDTSDFQEAKGLYEQAAAKYAEAVDEAGKREKAVLLHKPGEIRKVNIGNAQTLEMVWIPPGEFMMGSPENEKGRGTASDERQHRVRLTRGFWLGKTEVTNLQYRQFDMNHSSGVKKETNLNGDLQPVVNVSWLDATAFCAWLTRTTGKEFRLPTEAEWEYACRAGTTTTFIWGADVDEGRGWCNGADSDYIELSRAATTTNDLPWSDGYAFSAPVASFSPNDWGLYDMIGNVDEWCMDDYGEYPSGPVTDPISEKGPNSCKVWRGASWCSGYHSLRPAYRDFHRRDWVHESVGFRVAASELD